MKIPVIAYHACNGCGTCVALFPEVFVLRGDKAWVRNYHALGHALASRIIMSCPVRAIEVDTA